MSQAPAYFLWPQPKPLRAMLNAWRFVTISQIEKRLSEMFPSGTPVLFSSGRAALCHALLISGLARGDKAGVFPFANHCVLDAVSRIATPTAVGSDTSLNVVFQQWGYVQHNDLSAHDVEDCVDSLLVPGGEAVSRRRRFRGLVTSKDSWHDGRWSPMVPLCRSGYSAASVAR